jgi:mobilome CxxCx(11)CxxC protein
MKMCVLDNLRSECWKQAVYAYSGVAIFEHRANLLRRRLRTLTFLGIAVPGIAGFAYLTYGDNWFAKFLVGVAGILGLLQLIGSIWSLVFHWDDDFAYALESMSVNQSLFDRFSSLASRPPATAPEMQMRFEIISVENEARTASDHRQGITEDEKRFGMRAALRQLQKSCAGCGLTPKSLEPTNCDVCGNFKQRRF